MGTKCSTFVIILFLPHANNIVLVVGILLYACSSSTCCYRLKNFYFPSLPKSMSGGYFNSSFLLRKPRSLRWFDKIAVCFLYFFSKLLHKQNAFMGAIIFNVLGWTFKRIFAGQHFFFDSFSNNNFLLPEEFPFSKVKVPSYFFYY